MVNTKSILSRSTAIGLAAVLTLASAVPILFSARADAALLESRSITLETSAPSNPDTIYSVSFDTNSTGGNYVVGGLVVEFCAGSPIIGDSTCATPAGFDLDETNITVANQAGVTDWSVNAGSDTNTLMLTSVALGTITQGTTLSFDLGDGGANGVTNPSAANTSFFARIAIYTSAAGATGYTSAAPGAYQDAGGIALSTANQILVTAKVAERLTFCVYTGINCAAAGTAVTLGDDNGTLDPGGPFVDKTTKFDVATNAVNNAVVVMKGDTPTSGAFQIENSLLSGTGAAGNTAYVSALGTEQFGMCAEETTTPTLGPVTLDAPYDNGDCGTTAQTAGTGATGGEGTALFGFDTANATGSTGSSIATKPAGDLSTVTLSMLGNISNSTEAGIYTTTLTFIATGTY